MSVFVVWIVTLGSFKVFGTSVEQVGCSMWDIANKYEESCQIKYMEEIFFEDELNNGEIYPDEFLEKLSSTCSKYEAFMNCVNCTARHVCPEEEMKFKELLNTQWNLFCDEDQPADWLRTILQNQYSYRSSCEGMFKLSYYPCMSKFVPPEHLANASSLTDVSELNKLWITYAFKCSIAEILRYAEGAKYCGSTWQDILLPNWLKHSTEESLGFNIREGEVEMLKAMRCENMSSVNIRQAVQKEVP